MSYADVDVLELLDGIRMDALPRWAGDRRPAAEPARPDRIFLASSSELGGDRDAFDLYFRQQNDRRRQDGRYREIVRWESFLDAKSATRLQDEYNRAVRDCDGLCMANCRLLNVSKGFPILWDRAVRDLVKQAALPSRLTTGLP